MTEDRRVEALTLLAERASADAVGALRAAGIRHILLKGPLQQAWLEPAGPPRPSIDVDVLVAPGQHERAGNVLEELGYAPAVILPDEVGREHASVWAAVGRLPVELHWSLVGVDQKRLWDILASETERAELFGEPVEIPNEAARCLIVALHAAQHGVGQTAIFGDLMRALVVAKPESWERAFELARAVGGWVPFAAALSVTADGQRLLARLGAEPPVLDERQALSLLTPAPTSRGFYFLARQRGVRGKLGFVLMKLVPSSDFMRLRYPAARRGRLGLLAAYAYRPLWLARWSIPGLRSWRQAQDLAKSTRERR